MSRITIEVLTLLSIVSKDVMSNSSRLTNLVAGTDTQCPKKSSSREFFLAKTGPGGHSPRSQEWSPVPRPDRPCSRDLDERSLVRRVPETPHFPESRESGEIPEIGRNVALWGGSPGTPQKCPNRPNPGFPDPPLDPPLFPPLLSKAD